MAGGGFILGGLLSGIGRGIEQNAIENRRIALERLRQQYETDARAEQYEQQELRDKRQAGAQLQRDEIQQENAVERLRVGGDIQANRDDLARQHDLRMVAVRGAEDRITNAARAALDNNDVQSTFTGADGNVRLVTRGGRVIDTRVPERPPASSTNTSEGGRLTEAEQEAAFTAARRRWIDGGRQGTAPSREDFIGMTREDFARSRDGRDTGGQGGNQQQGRQGTSDRQRALAELGTIYGNATPERYPGLFRNGRKIPMQEARRMIEQAYPD